MDAATVADAEGLVDPPGTEMVATTVADAEGLVETPGAEPAGRSSWTPATAAIVRTAHATRIGTTRRLTERRRTEATASSSCSSAVIGFLP
jgi:hypothetical protein